MTAEIINLRRVRREKTRVEREARADARRAQFGRSKAQKQKEGAEKAKALRLIDGHLRDKTPEPR
jgi:hypothetical protein